MEAAQPLKFRTLRTRNSSTYRVALEQEAARCPEDMLWLQKTLQVRSDRC